MDETGDLDQLERQTAQLRRQMALDVDEVVRRVSPRRFISTAVAYTRNTAVAYTRKTQPALRAAVGAMKQDPIPYLLIGVGAAGTAWAATSFWRLRSQEQLHIKETVRSENPALPPPASRLAGVAPPKNQISPGGGEDEGRGRDADSPAQIPKRGWKDILLRVYNGIGEDRILMNAAGVTFYALLALFPAIAAFVSIYGLFADPQTIINQLDVLAGVLPGGGMEVIREQFTRLVSQPSGALTLGVVFGVLTSLWSANGGMKGVFDALNVVYGEEEKRSFLWLNLTTLVFTLGMLLFAIVALAAIVVIPIILKFFPTFVGSILNIARWPVIAALVAVVLALIYRYGPSRDKPKWRWITWGSATAAVLWLAFSAIYSWYTANFGTFNATYGSLGAAIGFMLWMWLSTTVVLLGGKLNAEIEHQTARDSTEGPPEPIGQRHARVADGVGPQQD
jgi:membrane protein